MTVKGSGVSDVARRCLLSTIVCLCCTDCNLPASDTSGESRYQLTKDPDGRVLRLDTVTGELTVAAPASETNPRPVAPPTIPTKPAPPERPAEGVADDRPVPNFSSPVQADSQPIAQIPISTTATATRSAGIDMCSRSELTRQAVTLADTAVYVEPRVTQTPITTIASAVLVTVAERSGEWVVLRFNDARWGARAGYTHCSQLRALDIPTADRLQAVERSQLQQPDARVRLTPIESVPAETRVTAPIARGSRLETVQGYAEWIRDGHLIVGGQRIAWDGNTRLRAGRVRSPRDVPIGAEITAKGVRTAEGILFAREIQAKLNGVALYENDARRVSAELEETYVRVGRMFEFDSRGMPFEIGRVLSSGPDVDRVRRIVNRLAPPSLDIRSVRLYVVETQEWNAKAAGNGAIWVFTGLLASMSDDELAIILGHELAHYTHEHMRRRFKTAMLTQLVGVAADVALTNMGDGAARAVLTDGARLGLSAWRNGYSRDLEDEADRVGLRYAYEGGFNVTDGPRVWERFRARYGEQGSVTNWFKGSHSRPSDRIRNLERQLTLNYRSNR
jgi:Zn-dependent protease with chaperone function